MFDPGVLLKKVPAWVWIAGAVGVAIWVSKKGVAGVAADVTSGAIKGAGDVANGAITGTVKGIGSVFGVPDTDRAQCEACLRNGDDWCASKYCTAAQFYKWQSLSIRKKIFGTPFSMSDVFN